MYQYHREKMLVKFNELNRPIVTYPLSLKLVRVNIKKLLKRLNVKKREVKYVIFFLQNLFIYHPIFILPLTAHVRTKRKR
jgi:hypothetical protein